MTRLADGIYGLLLRILPADERREFGPEMARLFADYRRDARGRPLVALSLWVAAFRDVLSVAWSARRPSTYHSRFHSRSAMTKSPRRFVGGVLLQDLRFGLRLLAKHPGFTAVAVLILTLGIGVNTAAFSLVNTMLLQPRSGGMDGRLAGVFARHQTQPDTYRGFSWQEFVWLRQQHQVFASVTVHGFGMTGLREGDIVRRVFTDIVPGNYFETFGVRPVIGRTFTAEEERPGAGIPVVVIGHTLWTRLGQPADILERTIDINSRPYSVIGVAPEGFGGTMVMVTPELFVPTGMFESVSFDLNNEGQTAHLSDPAVTELLAVALLKPGVSPEAAQAALAPFDATFGALDPTGKRDHTLELARLPRLSVSTEPQTDGPMIGAASALLSLAAIVLVIASVNLANMLIARGRARQKEFAIRQAIGGGRWRLVRQLLTESLVLASLGAAGGLVFSWWAMGLLVAAMPSTLPMAFVVDPAPDVRVLTFTTVFAVLATMAFGLGPAWKLSRTSTLPSLTQQADTPDGSARRRRVSSRDVLVMAQLALTFVMLTVGGLFVRGALEAADADPGFTFDAGIIASVDTSLSALDRTRSEAFSRQALDRLRTLPGVARAGFASHLPFGEFEESTVVQRVGAVITRDDPAYASSTVAPALAAIGGDYFEALGVPIVAGRMFTPGEVFNPDSERVVIVDAQVANALFQGSATAALDEFIQLPSEREGDAPIRARIVGIAGPVRANLFDEGPRPFLYQPYSQAFRANIYFHVQTTSGDATTEGAMLPAVRQALREADAEATVLSVETRPMFRKRHLLLTAVRMGAAIFGAFGIAALFLAAVGLYGVKAYAVSQRTREIGVRIALGAEPRHVVSMVLREGLALVGLGLAVGVVLSVVIGGAMRGLLFQGRALDVPVVIAAAVTLIAAMVLAALGPARRAVRIAPNIAMRN